VVLDVEAVEVGPAVEGLVFDVARGGVELLLDVALGAGRQELDDLFVTVAVVTGDAEHVVDEFAAVAVAQPVGGVVERLADVSEVLLVVAHFLREVDVVGIASPRAVRDAGDGGDVAQVVGQRRVDHPGEFDAHHPGRDAVVLVVEVGLTCSSMSGSTASGSGWWWSTTRMGMS